MAEPGGDPRVIERLRERKCFPEFAVHSDPGHTLHPLSPPPTMVLARQNASKYLGDYVDYDMHQPALFVLDAQLKVVTWWSWHLVPSFNPEEPQGSWDLIRSRPLSEDILPALAEGRPIQLANVM